jgi:ankyrin repeat protein
MRKVCNAVAMTYEILIFMADMNGDTALIRASWTGQHNVVKYLTEHGADVNTKSMRLLTSLVCKPLILSF